MVVRILVGVASIWVGSPKTVGGRVPQRQHLSVGDAMLKPAAERATANSRCRAWRLQRAGCADAAASARTRCALWQKARGSGITLCGEGAAALTRACSRCASKWTPVSQVWSYRTPQQVLEANSLWFWRNAGKGSRQTGSVTLGQGLARQVLAGAGAERGA